MAERPEDLNLPTSVVSKIIKDCLPTSCKVSKEANVAIAKAASVFVLYATSSANTVAQKSNRKTITGTDVVNAMTDMEFDKFVRPLENSLAIWKKSQQTKKDSAAAKKKEKESVKDGEKEGEKGDNNTSQESASAEEESQNDKENTE